MRRTHSDNWKALACCAAMCLVFAVLTTWTWFPSTIIMPESIGPILMIAFVVAAVSAVVVARK